MIHMWKVQVTNEEFVLVDPDHIVCIEPDPKDSGRSVFRLSSGTAVQALGSVKYWESVVMKYSGASNVMAYDGKSPGSYSVLSGLEAGAIKEVDLRQSDVFDAAQFLKDE